MEWISVKDRLPENEGRLIVLCEKVVMPAHFYPEYVGGPNFEECDIYSNCADFLDLDKVTHWMPLPEPPKE